MHHACNRRKPRSMDISISIAITLGSPRPLLESESEMTARKMDLQQSDESNCGQSLYHTKTFGRKNTRNSYSQALHCGLTAQGMDFRKWYGAARFSSEWDELRRDSDLWFNNGDCHVHLHAKGQSQRAPNFQVPIKALMAANAERLLGRCLVESVEEVPCSDEESNFRASTLDLYISAPPDTERGQAFLYHTATRNFFAWVFRRSLVGSHLGGALVGLLNSMNEFRSAGEDNLQAIFDYMEEEEYLDMRNSPDHALGVLFFAEHFQLLDIWTEAFVHCVGMYESLPRSPGFEYISQNSRALITRSFAEMDMRLALCSQKLGTFLSDELSDAYLGIPSSAKNHLEKFRSFLHTLYIAKLGYYPPSIDYGIGVFPKSILNQMVSDFKKLYEFLVDTSFTPRNLIPAAQYGGICVMQNVQAFDHLYKHAPLDHPLPLLPQITEYEYKKSVGKLRRRLSLPNTKSTPDKRLLTCAALLKATNWDKSNLNECSIVRAYRGFERDCVFSSPIDKHDTLSQTDGRKVRWLLIYSILQTLISATDIPQQVRDTQNVQYNLCVTTPGSPPWDQPSRPCEVLYRLRTGQPEQEDEDFTKIETGRRTASLELKPDIDYQAIQRKNQHSRAKSDNTSTILRSNSFKSRTSTIRRALSSLGNMPELQHPKPSRISYHEIVVHGYGNGTNDVKFTDVSTTTIPEVEEPQPKSPAESQISISEKTMSRWSHTSEEDDETHSSTGSSYSASGSDSFSSIDLTKESINKFINTNRGVSVLGLARAPSTVYSASIYEDNEEKMALEPAPLQLRMATPEKLLQVPQHINNLESLGINRELEEYLDA